MVRQEKWSRKFTGPFLVVGLSGSVTVKLQRSRRSKPFYTHVDKVKPYEAEQLPKSWLDEITDSGERAAAAAEQTAVKLMGNDSKAAESSADDSAVKR